MTQAGPDSADEKLFVGIDLGTSCSSIATSTDIRSTVSSVVGWPKDLISYKSLQKQVVIGEECLQNRMAVDMIWPLEHGVFHHPPTQNDDDSAADSDSREAEAIQHLVSYIIELAERQPDQEIRFFPHVCTPVLPDLVPPVQILYI